MSKRSIFTCIFMVYLLLTVVSSVFAYDPYASQIKTDTSNFDNNLSTSDTNVQTALETLDELVGGSQEAVEDYAGAMWSGNTETRVTVTYQDSDGTMDIVVDDMNDDVPEAGDFGNATDLDANGAIIEGAVGFTELASDLTASVTNGASTLSTGNQIYDFVIGQGYVDTETDPVYVAWDKDYDDLTNTPDCVLNNDLTNKTTNIATIGGWDTNVSDDFDGAFTSLSSIPAGLSDGDDDTTYTAGYGIDITSEIVSINNLTTGDVTEATNLNYVSDDELTVLQNTSGVNTGDQDLSTYLTKTGTENYLRKSDANGIPVDSVAYDDGTNVGIGTATPGHLVTIEGAASASQLRINNTGTAGGLYFIASDADTGVVSAGSEWNGSAWVARSTDASNYEMKDGYIQFRCDHSLTSGNTFTPTLIGKFVNNGGNARLGVGIDPSYAFHVKANSGNAFMTLETGTSDIAGLALGDSDKSYQGQVQYTNADDFMRLKANNTEIITIDGPNERVGIGDTTPDVKLDIVGDAIISTSLTAADVYISNALSPSGTVKYAVIDDTTGLIGKSGIDFIQAGGGGAEADTLDTVTGRGNSTSNSISVAELTVSGNSDTQWFYNNGTDTFHKFSDGELEISSTETNTYVRIGKNDAGGSGTGTLAIQDDSGAYFTEFTQDNATLNIQPKTSAAHVVINDDSGAGDFRVESGTLTHVLFVDGGLDRVGINDDTPDALLDIGGDAIVDSDLTVGRRLSAVEYGSDGTVSNAELLYINSLSSNAQDQINGKQATVTEGSLSDGVVVSADIKDGDVDFSTDTNATAGWGVVFTDDVISISTNLTTGLASTDLSDTADILYESELDSLSELDTQIGTTGTANATTYLRGDNSWATPAGGSGAWTATDEGAYLDGDATSSGDMTIDGVYYGDGSQLTGIAEDLTRVGFAAMDSSTTINAGSMTVAVFGVEIEDTDTAWNGSVFTVPAGKGGMYTISAVYTFASVTDGNRYIVGIGVNTSSGLTYMIGRGIAGGTNLCGAGGNVKVELDAGDLVRCIVWCENATTGYGSTDGYCSFSAYFMDQEYNVNGEASGGAVDSVNGEVGVVVLDTADIAEATDANYVSDAQLVVIGNTSNTNSGDITLNASATTGGMSLAGQEISNRAATNTQTGYMTDTLVGNIETNNAKVSNVSTTLSLGTVGATTVSITSDGSADDVTLPAATTDYAGMLTADLFDEIDANTAKVTNATHSGEVTGATALTIANNVVDEANMKISNAPTNDYVLTADSGETGGWKWAAPTGGGYTNLTSFVDQTAWRLFYSNADGDVTELELGADGTYLKSNGAAVAPTFATPSGGGTPGGSDTQIQFNDDSSFGGISELTYSGSAVYYNGVELGESSDMAAATFYDNTGGEEISTTYEIINLDTAMTNNDTDIYSISSDVVTVNADGFYLISYSVGIIESGIETRASIDMKLQMNTGSGMADVDGSYANTYWRAASDNGSTASKTIVLEMSDGDSIQLMAVSPLVDSVTTVADASSITFVQLKGAKGDKGDTGAAGGVADSSIEFVIDGGGDVIATGIKGDIQLPYDFDIDTATILADQSGSIVVDIWVDTYANYPPTDVDTITSSTPITISTATKAQDTTLTSWTTSLSADDIIRFNVDSCSTIEKVTIILSGEKS